MTSSEKINPITSCPMISLDLSLELPSIVEPSPNVMRVAAMFGLGIDERKQMTILPALRLDLRAGQVVFITGASGGGKSTILRLIREKMEGCDDVRVIAFDQLQPPAQKPLVDCFGVQPLERVLYWLSLAGLSDAFVMLRKPCELSDGQRYRLRLAQAMSMASAEPSSRLVVLLADELGATLDRLTASVIARNIRKWISPTRNVCFVGATTHDDLLEPLEPDVLIEKQAGSGVLLLTRAARHSVVAPTSSEAV